MDVGTVRAAQGDAWFALGLLHQPYGGGAVEQPGVRLMASGLPHPQWNNGDVDDPGAVDVEAAAAWFAALGVPWGVRVPAGAAWSAGRYLFRKRLMGLDASDLRPAAAVAGLRIGLAGPADLDDVCRVDATAFEADVDEQKGWMGPHLGAVGVTTALGRIDGELVATAYTVVADGRAGRTACLAGVAVLPSARRRGVAAAVSSWLLERALADGCALAHLNPDTDDAARVYARLGFAEVEGFDVYVVRAAG